MKPSSQISAPVSPETKDQLDRFSDESGLKKGHIVEQALLHHLQAMAELPPDVVIPPRLVLTSQAGKRVLERLQKPRRPTRAMKALFRDDAED